MPQPPLPWGKSLLVPTEWEAVCPPQPLWLFWRQERHHTPARSRNLDQPVQSIVTIPTELLGPNIRIYINITPAPNPYTLVRHCHTIKHITVCRMQYLFCTKNSHLIVCRSVTLSLCFSSCSFCGCYACHDYYGHFIYHSLLQSLSPTSQSCVPLTLF